MNLPFRIAVWKGWCFPTEDRLIAPLCVSSGLPRSRCENWMRRTWTFFWEMPVKDKGWGNRSSQGEPSDHNTGTRENIRGRVSRKPHTITFCQSLTQTDKEPWTKFVHQRTFTLGRNWPYLIYCYVHWLVRSNPREARPKVNTTVDSKFTSMMRTKNRRAKAKTRAPVR